MGGLCFIFSICAASIIFFAGAKLALPELLRSAIVLGAAVLCGLLGLADDYGKIASRSNAGISGKTRLAFEFGLGLALGAGLYFLKLTPDLILWMDASGARVISWHMPGIYELAYDFLLLPFLYAATSNALNLHDGMDGLCAGTSSILFATLALMLAACAFTGLSWLSAASLGALLGFLIYNKYKAKIFMGDTGSLFIGACFAGLVASSGLLLWFIPLALIYIVETLSVILQVAYFKLSKPYEPEKKMAAPALVLYKLTHKLPGEGKRLFRMAPIHHHFEALAGEAGKKEWQVVIWFWLVQLLICGTLLALFMRRIF